MYAGPPRPTPAPAHRQPHHQPHRQISRRAALVTGTLALLAGAGGGTAAALLRHLPGTTAQPPPPELVSALAAEDALAANAEAALSAQPSDAAPSLRAALSAIHGDHIAHRTALQAALAGYRQTGSGPAGVTSGVPVASPPSPGAPSTAPTASPHTPGGVREAEQLAATVAAGRAATLTGRDATLLASIAACEAAHAVYLDAVS